MGLQVALGKPMTPASGKVIQPVPVRGRSKPSPDPSGGSATPTWKHSFTKPSPTLRLYFPGHLEHSLLNRPSGPTWARTRCPHHVGNRTAVPLA